MAEQKSEVLTEDERNKRIAALTEKEKLTPGHLQNLKWDTTQSDEAEILKVIKVDTWSNGTGKTYNVRTKGYAGHGKKAPSLTQLYEVFELDVYKCKSKINNVARFYNVPKRPSPNGDFDIPPLICINMMIPDYSPPLFGDQRNGDGFSMIAWAELSDHTKKIMKEGKLTPSLALWQEFVKGGKESKYGDCLKCISRVCNNSEASKKYGRMAAMLVNKYNGTPFLCRVSSTFYYMKEEGYMAIDVDVHHFSKMARKGLAAIKDYMKSVVFDIGFVIEARANEHQPEQMLTSMRVSKIGKESAKKFPYDNLLAPAPESKKKKKKKKKDAQKAEE